MAGTTNLVHLRPRPKATARRIVGCLLSPLAFGVAFLILKSLQPDLSVFRGVWAVILTMTVGAASLELLGMTPLIAFFTPLILLWNPTEGSWHLTSHGLVVMPLTCGACYFVICRGVGHLLTVGILGDPEGKDACRVSAGADVLRSGAIADAPDRSAPVEGQDASGGKISADRKTKTRKTTLLELAERSYLARRNGRLDGVADLDLSKLPEDPTEFYSRGFVKDKAANLLVDTQELEEDEFLVIDWPSTSDTTMYVLTNYAFYFWVDGDRSRFARIDLDDVKACSRKRRIVDHDSVVFTLANGESHAVRSVPLATIVVSYIAKRMAAGAGS
jgi:hypothetical protein